MVEVYYYVPVSDLEYIVECGLKLSAWADKEVTIHGESRKCISALLNPKDDIEKYRSGDYRCIKLEIKPGYCFAADRYLYTVGVDVPEAMRLYEKSVIAVDKYVFGSYRMPECLVTSTVIGEHISVLDKRLDSPVLFDNSEELYINNIIEAYKDKHNNFIDAMLYYFYNRLAEVGRIYKIEDHSRNVAVFVDEIDSKTVTVKIPDIDKYQTDKAEESQTGKGL